MDLSWDSFAAGASGGIPITIFLLWGLRSHNEKLESISTRIQRLELAFDLQSQERLKSLAEKIEKLFGRQEKLEKDLAKVSSDGANK